MNENLQCVRLRKSYTESDPTDQPTPVPICGIEKSFVEGTCSSSLNPPPEIRNIKSSHHKLITDLLILLLFKSGFSPIFCSMSFLSSLFPTYGGTSCNKPVFCCFQVQWYQPTVQSLNSFLCRQKEHHFGEALRVCTHIFFLLLLGPWGDATFPPTVRLHD